MPESNDPSEEFNQQFPDKTVKDNVIKLLDDALKYQEQYLTKRLRISRYINMWTAAWLGFLLITWLLVKGIGPISLFIGPTLIVFTAYVLDETFDPWMRKKLLEVQEKDNDSNGS